MTETGGKPPTKQPKTPRDKQAVHDLVRAIEYFTTFPYVGRLYALEKKLKGGTKK